jgi:lysophospholipase-2
MPQRLENHTVLPSTFHTHTIIFLHGRGSTASTFHSEVFESQDSQDKFFTQIFPSIKWIFPCAPKSWAETDGEEMCQWFDMVSVQRPWEGFERQRTSLEENAEQVMGLIEQEAKQIGKERVILAGISQGCATAIYTIITREVRLGGFFGLCGWLPVIEQELQLGVWQETPVLLQHCEDDLVVPVENGKSLTARLKHMGMQVRWECFEDGNHWLNEPQGMDGIVRFIKEVMEKRETTTT